MKITSLKLEREPAGNKISVWVECDCVSDIDKLIRWLQLAKHVMTHDKFAPVVTSIKAVMQEKTK